MQNNANSPVADLFNRDPVDQSVAVADGYNLSLRVHHGCLIIEDGIGQHRRLRRYSRAERTMRRIVFLGHTGYVTLEALRWCADIGIAVIHLDGDGRILTVHGRPGRNDARLRRAQAAAPANPVGLEIAKGLLSAKLEGQAAVVDEILGFERVVRIIRSRADEIQQADDLSGCRELEAQASNAYFGAWTGSVACHFVERDTAKVPTHWHVFRSRTSPLRRGSHSPREAANPINALLNYGYALAEAEARIALLTLGLDPGLGIIHTDARNRDSLALDILEPLRPIVEREVLRLLRFRYFRWADFHETRQGACRVLAPFTHELATHMSDYARAVAPIAEQVTHALASSSPGKIALSTPLSRANYSAAQTPGPKPRRSQPAAPRKAKLTCRSCGAELYGSARQYCTACWPVTRAALAEQRAQAGYAARAAAIAEGRDPSQTPGARTKRHQALVGTKAAEKAWIAKGGTAAITEQELHEVVLPKLAELPLSQLERATGLSNSACSRIRSGRMTPHPRHWDTLASLAQASSPDARDRATSSRESSK